jgi:hypothetical protein
MVLLAAEADDRDPLRLRAPFASLRHVKLRMTIVENDGGFSGAAEAAPFQNFPELSAGFQFGEHLLGNFLQSFENTGALKSYGLDHGFIFLAQLFA